MSSYPNNLRPLIRPQAIRSHHRSREIAEAVRLRPRRRWGHVRNAIVLLAVAVAFWIVIVPAVAMILHSHNLAGDFAVGQVRP